MTAIASSKKSQSFVYDFAVDGGAIGIINMGIFLPANATIYYGYAKVITTLTSGGAATIAVSVAGSTNILISATAVASWTAGATLSGVDLTDAPFVVLTVGVQLNVTIAAAALTAGKFVYFVEYTEWSI